MIAYVGEESAVFDDFYKEPWVVYNWEIEDFLGVIYLLS